MKRIIIFLVFISCSSAWANVAAVTSPVNGCKVVGSAIATLTCTYTPVTGNNVTIILGTLNTVTSPSCKDNNSNLLTAGAVEAPTNITVMVFTGTAVTGATAYTCTWTTNRSAILMLQEYSGVNAINTALSGNTASATSGSASLTVTTQDANDFNVCGFINNSTAPFTVTVGTSRQSGTEVTLEGVMLDNTSATAGSVTCTATLSSNAWVGTSVELRSSAGSPLGSALAGASTQKGAEVLD